MPTIQQINDEKAYSQSYRESMFNIWYQAECPPMTELVKIIPPDEQGRTPDPPTLRRWHNLDGWDEHADALNGQLAVQTDQLAIQERMEMFKKHAELGKTLAQKGEEYITEHGLSTGAEAIRAVIEGTDLERKSLGYAEFFNKIVNASNEELDKQLKRLTGGGDILEGEAKDVDESESKSESDS